MFEWVSLPWLRSPTFIVEADAVLACACQRLTDGERACEEIFVSQIGKMTTGAKRCLASARSPRGDTPTARQHLNMGVAAQLACLLEVSAPKPGNVSPGRHFADLRYEDFLASALAIGEPMAAR